MPKFIPFLVLVLLTGTAAGDEPQFKNERAKKAEAAYQAKLKEAREAYIKELEVAIKESGGAGDLDEANKMAELKDSLVEAGESEDRDEFAAVRRELEGTTWKSSKDPRGFHRFLKDNKTINAKGTKGVWVVTDEKTAVMQNYNSADVHIFEFDDELKTAKVSKFVKSKDDSATFRRR